MMSLTEILLCTFFSNSIFLSWFLIKPWWSYSEQQKEHIQEGAAYQCIWNNYIIFAQKYYNSATLSMWVKFSKISIKMKNCKTFYKAQTASRLKEII